MILRLQAKPGTVTTAARMAVLSIVIKGMWFPWVGVHCQMKEVDELNVTDRSPCSASRYYPFLR